MSLHNNYIDETDVQTYYYYTNYTKVVPSILVTPNTAYVVPILFSE